MPPPEWPFSAQISGFSFTAHTVHAAGIQGAHREHAEGTQRISLGDGTECANSVGFRGVVIIVPDLCPLCVPWGGGYMGYIRKALEKGYLEHPRSACCTDDMFEIFVRFGRCLRSLLPLFVNRQLPCPHTNLHHVLLLPPMHYKSVWCAKERAQGV